MVNDNHVCQCHVCPPTHLDLVPLEVSLCKREVFPAAVSCLGGNLDCSRWAINRVNLYIIELVGCGIFGGDDQ